MKSYAALAFFLLLAACSSAPVQPPPTPDSLFADARFVRPARDRQALDVFALSDAMKRYASSGELAAQLRAKGIRRGLIEALYDQGLLRLEYDSSMTRTAAEAFDARAGNCLSLVIMTAAFASELGLEVQFQSVPDQESWGRSGDLYLAVGHVNLTLGKQSGGVYALRSTYEALIVDFVPGADIRSQRSVPISEATIVAMYMSNRAAEALAKGEIDAAYWWAREALRREPKFMSAYNTLAVIYRRHGDLGLAERVFKEVLQREPANTQAMSNLALLLTDVGRHAEADALKVKLTQLQPHPPFSYFNQGLAAMQQGDYQAAKVWFGKEVDRAAYYHEFHYWLARAHYALGEFDAAREQMALAVENTTTHKDHDLYAAKLDWLSHYHPQ